MITRILIGIAVSALGVLMAWKTPFFLEAIGRIETAEKYLGPGGTRLFLKLLGIGITLIGFMVITNLFDTIVGGFVKSIFP